MGQEVTKALERFGFRLAGGTSCIKDVWIGVAVTGLADEEGAVFESLTTVLRGSTKPINAHVFVSRRKLDKIPRWVALKALLAYLSPFF